MKCTTCGQKSNEGASFCSNCGSALVLKCPSCSAPSDLAASFCSNCGTPLTDDEPDTTDHLARYIPAELQAKLQAARAGKTMAGERRTITVLFADVEGSTAAAEQLDPEEWAEIVNGAFERLIGPVYRYEGTLARLMGDAILAFFGAPIAHEDDPERAIMAGLEMLSAATPFAREVETTWGVDFDLRVGINTGLVVVGEVGSDLRVEYTALGDAVNVAARMEQTAAPGTLQITDDTARLVEGLFDLEALEPVAAKGKAAPVPAFRVIAPTPTPRTQGVLGRDTRIIGRTSELSTLQAMIEAVRQGEGQICTLIGEAGVGKSKLAGALKADLARSRSLTPWLSSGKGQVRWAEARCISYDASVPYAVFTDLLAGMFDFADDDTTAGMRSKIRSAVADVLDDPGPAATYIGVLLGCDPEPEMEEVVSELDPPALQRQVFSAVITFLEASTRNTPGVLVFEDVHWADPVSLALLEELMQVTDRSQLAIVALMRPYREDTSWGFHETAQRDYSHRYAAIQLEPLDDTSARQLVTEILGDQALPSSLHDLIRNRADGNPFFVEEILRDMLESGSLSQEHGQWRLEDTDHVAAMPGTIAGLLNARLDRLDEGSRHTLQLASVLGREFEFSELAELTDAVDVEATIDELVRRDLLVELRQIPTRIHAFRHALIQETAYDTILLKTRRSLHATVAEHLIDRRSEPHDIARHLIRSGQQNRAVPYLADAGDLAARSMSLADAIRHYSDALEFSTDDEDVQLVRRLYEGLGSAYTLIPDLSEASTSYQRLLEVGQERSDPSLQIAALTRLGFMAVAMGGDYRRATQHLERARLLAEESGDDLGLAQYHMTSCLIATSRGDLEKAAHHDAGTSRAGDVAGADRIRLGGLVQRAMTLVLAAEYDEATEALEAAKDAATESPRPNVKSMLITSEALLDMRNGAVARAWELMKTNAEETVRLGSSKASNVALLAAWIGDQVGDVETTLALLAQSRRLGDATDQQFNSAAAVASMARLYTELGMSGADELEATALEYLDVPFADMLSSSMMAELGRAALMTGRLDDASELFSRGLGGASATRWHETSALLLGLADVRIAQGDTDAARDLIDEALVFTSTREMRHRRPAEALTRGRLLETIERIDNAIEVLVAGTREAHEMGMVAMERRLITLLAAIHARAGRMDEAERHRSAAHDLISRQAGRIADSELRSSFVTSATAELPSLGASADRRS